MTARAMASVSAETLINPIKAVADRLLSRSGSDRQPSVGLDIGTASVKAVALGAQGRPQEREVLQHAALQTSNDPAELSKTIRSLLEQLKVSVRHVTIGVSGQAVSMRVVQLPMMDKREIKQAIPFEAQRYLPFPVRDLILDAQPLG